MDAGPAGELVLGDPEGLADLLDLLGEGVYRFANHCETEVTTIRGNSSRTFYVTWEGRGHGPGATRHLLNG